MSERTPDGSWVTSDEPVAELLPCPFCGSEAHMTRSPPSKYTKGGPPFSVECMNPECWAQMPWDLSEAKAAARWNRRADGENTKDGDQ